MNLDTVRAISEQITIMETTISAEKVRKQASQICREYLQVLFFTVSLNLHMYLTLLLNKNLNLQGSWKNVPKTHLIIRQISGGLSNLVFYVGLPSDVKTEGN